MTKPTNPDLLARLQHPREVFAQAARESLEPDPLRALQARVERLEAELRDEREHAAKVRALQRQHDEALAAMLDALWRALPADRRPQ